MSTTTKKPRGIPDEEVGILSTQVLSMLAKNDIFSARMAIRKILKMPGGGNKVIRNIFIIVLGNEWRLARILRESGALSSWSASIIRPIMLEKLTRIIHEYDQKDMVKPGKFYTIPKIAQNLLTIDPEILRYLFESGRIVQGKNFEIGNSNNRTPISINMTNSFLYEVGRMSEDETKVLGLNERILFDPVRLRLVMVERVRQNLVFLIEFFGKDYSTINEDALVLLTLEFTQAHIPIDRGYYGVMNKTSDVPKIPQGEFVKFAPKLRQSVFEAISLASDYINKQSSMPGNPFETYDVVYGSTTLYTEEAQGEEIVVEAKGETIDTETDT